MLVLIGITPSNTTPGEYNVTIPEFPECVTTGRSIIDAISNAESALKDYIQKVVIHGLPFEVVRVDYAEKMHERTSTVWTFIEYCGVLPDFQQYKTVGDYINHHQPRVIEINIDEATEDTEALRKHDETIRKAISSTCGYPEEFLTRDVAKVEFSTVFESNKRLIADAHKHQDIKDK